MTLVMNIKTLLLAAAVIGTVGPSAADNSSPYVGRSASANALVVAQNQPVEPKAQSSESKPTVSPERTRQNQPQGPTGPINTTTAGAPSESPQGETRPGMQSAPERSSKTTVGPKQ